DVAVGGAQLEEERVVVFKHDFKPCSHLLPPPTATNGGYRMFLPLPWIALSRRARPGPSFLPIRYAKLVRLLPWSACSTMLAYGRSLQATHNSPVDSGSSANPRGDDRASRWRMQSMGSTLVQFGGR